MVTRNGAGTGLDLCSWTWECDGDDGVSRHPDDCSAHANFSADKGSDLVTVQVAPLTSGEVGYVKPFSFLNRHTYTQELIVFPKHVMFSVVTGFSLQKQYKPILVCFYTWENKV